MPDPTGDRSRRKAGRGTYGWRDLSGDASGGAVAALIALPYGLAMARLMGLPPALGLFTSIATAPVTALLGRNPVLIGGTASATVPFLVASVQSEGVGGSAKVVLAASVLMMAFGLLKLGRYIARVPHAVVSGFSCGVGAMMVILQLRTLLGLPTSAGSPLIQLANTLGELGEARREPMVLGAIVILGAFLAARRWPRSPSALIGVGLAIAASHRLGWRERAVGAFSTDWPPLASFAWDASDLPKVLPTAFGLAVVASVNILITSRVVEHFRGRHRPLRPADADAELGAYGIANLCAGAFGAPPSVGIPARSLANVRSGGRTRLSNLAHAAVLVLLVRFGSGLIAQIPLASLAGVTAFVGLGLLEWSTWRRLPRMRRVDAAAFLATTFATLATNAVAAVAIGCSLYAARQLYLRLIGPIPAIGVIGPREVEG
ncbi:SulP family inorganic anion transporter [Tundrisphaera lichenicola]|uniref:SulP family inorganic anion transporter n=1 Tax=Tundrisphaera lichenicola TaxID=2029860 RepID=UPI003EBBB0E4